MKFKIKEIGLYNQQTVDIVSFKDGVNIISGTSKTGKSSIGKIINYCLASSSNVVPDGVLRKNTDIYAILLEINTHLVLIARNRYDSETLEGEKYIFIEKLDLQTVSLKNLSYKYFEKNDTKYIKIKDFLELEIVKYFPSFPPKTRKDGKEFVRPSIRNMPPFIFQNQNIISNEATLLFDMDKPNKQRGIIRDFELFLGLVDNNTYNMINRKNQLLKEIKKLKDKQELYKEELDSEIKKLKGHYQQLYSYMNIDMSDDLEINDLKDIETLDKLNVDYQIKSTVSQEYYELRDKCNQKSRIVEKLKFECTNIENQIKSINKTSMNLEVLSKHNDENHLCPLCNSDTEKIFKPFIEAKEKILSEQKFLNNYNQDILYEKLDLRKEELSFAEKDLILLLEQFNELKKSLDEVKTMEKAIAYQNEMKGIIKSSIKNIEKYEKLNNKATELEDLEKELEKLEKKLAKVNLKREIQIAENKISEYSTSVLKKLPFGSDEYGEANLRFNIKDISFYQQQPNSILYMNEMGSAENYLSCHLAIFLGLHKFIQSNPKSILPSLIFLDQPSQVYFPDERDISSENKSGDILSVETIYKTIIEFIDDWNLNNDIPIQLIIVDHFYNDESWFQERLIEPRWINEQGIGLIKQLGLNQND